MTVLPTPSRSAASAKIIGETAGIDRFKSRDAYARCTGTALAPVWSSTKPGTG